NALPLYLDAGLTLMKLVEEAHVVLDDFDLKGSHRAHLRYALKRGERDGFSVEVIDQANVPASLETNDTATTEIYTLSLHELSDLGGRRIIYPNIEHSSHLKITFLSIYLY